MEFKRISNHLKMIGFSSRVDMNNAEMVGTETDRETIAIIAVNMETHKLHSTTSEERAHLFQVNKMAQI